jgi:hypothetical protein
MQLFQQQLKTGVRAEAVPSEIHQEVGKFHVDLFIGIVTGLRQPLQGLLFIAETEISQRDLKVHRFMSPERGAALPAKFYGLRFSE